MRRAEYGGIRDIRVQEVDDPEPGDGEVRVRIKYCGICGSDVHEYLHGRFPRSSWGHEACGEVTDTGPGVTDLQVGDRVIAYGPGAYADYLTTPASRVRKLDDRISWERAAVLEPLAGAAYAVGRAGLGPDDTLLITGAGPIGLSFLAAARAIGLKRIYMTEMQETRTAKALEMGATAVFDPRRVKVPHELKSLTDGQGVDIAIEAVGVPASLKDCLASTRYRGKVIVHGIFTERAELHMLGFVSREITMIGTNSIDMEQALVWALAGKVAPEAMISRRIPLEAIDEQGFGALTRPGNTDIKILVAPHG